MQVVNFKIVRLQKDQTLGLHGVVVSLGCDVPSIGASLSSENLSMGFHYLLTPYIPAAPVIEKWAANNGTIFFGSEAIIDGSAETPEATLELIASVLNSVKAEPGQ